VNFINGDAYDLVRIDCGEFQHKHENAKIIGAPPGYVGYDDGGQLTTAVAKHPHTVVLLDEVEKAHSDLWHTFLRVFDEGVLTDGTGDKVSFKDTIIIMTTNLGNREVVEDMIGDTIGFGSMNFIANTARRERIAMKALRKSFAPELLNRIDKVVVFNHLTEANFGDIAALELLTVGMKLAKKGFSLAPEPAVIAYMASQCTDSVENARKLSQIRRDEIENLLADEILDHSHPRGTVFQLSRRDGLFQVTVPKQLEKPATMTNEIKEK
jgi:ATP-dependent Clp protease ATP-binding subunit ClpA